MSDSENSHARDDTRSMNSTDFKKKFDAQMESFEVIQNNLKLHYVRCKVCIKHPKVVAIHTDNNKIPNITTATGCRFRTKYIEEHFSSRYHLECEKIEKLAPIHETNASPDLIDTYITKANKHLADHVGKLMIDVYNDGKN